MKISIIAYYQKKKTNKYCYKSLKSKQSWNINEKTILDNNIPNAGNSYDNDNYNDLITNRKKKESSFTTNIMIEDNNRNATNNSVLNTYYEAVQESLSIS